MLKNRVKRHMEQDDLILDNPQHWETWTSKVYLNYRRKQDQTWRDAFIRIPTDLVRHLKLKHKDEIIVAIKLP